MTTSPAVIAVKRANARPISPHEKLERSERRRVSVAVGLLFLNVLTFAAGTWNQQPLLIPIPHKVGQVITQGALPLALLIVLTVNRRMVIRPNVFLTLLTLLVIAAVISGVDPAGHFIGTLYRTGRLACFAATIWLLSPWWGRRDLLLIRALLASLCTVLATVLFGLLVAPGRALSGGRLSGEFWPTPPTQVADIAAVATGLVIVLWLCDRMRGRTALLLAVPAGIMLLLTHSRTSVVALVAGVFVAGMSIFTAKAKVRRLIGAAIGIFAVAVTVFSGLLTTWLVRGESSKELASLTGRTSVWTGVLNTPRTPFQVLFGFGLSNKAFNGFPIDSNWFAAYEDLGLAGVLISAGLLLSVLLAAYFQALGVQRALAIFLVIYLLITSITATGLSDASIATLELALAASLALPTSPDWVPL